MAIAAGRSSDLFIDGHLVSGRAGRYPNINPATEEVLGTAANANLADMDLAIGAARRAFEAAERQLSIEARAGFYAEADRIVLRDLPVIPLYNGVSHRLLGPRVRGWVDHPGHAHPSRFLSLA